MSADYSKTARSWTKQLQNETTQYNDEQTVALEKSKWNDHHERSKSQYTLKMAFVTELGSSTACPSSS